MRATIKAALCVALIALTSASVSSAHEGHDHNDAPPTAPAAAASRAETSTDAIELVAVARGQELEIFLDDARLNTPIVDAVIEVETPNGPAKATLSPDQVYRLPAVWMPKTGTLDLIFTVTLNGAVEILPLTIAATKTPPELGGRTAAGHSFSAASIGLAGVTFAIGVALAWALSRRTRKAAAIVSLMALVLSASAFAHEGEDHSTPAAAPPSAGRDVAERQSDGTIFVPKATQRIFGVRTDVTALKVYPRSIELPGRVIPDPNASGFVQAAVGGRLSPPDAGFPRLGTVVNKGDVLAYVTPPLQPIDVSDMRQRQGEIDQQISIVKKRIERLEILVPTGAAARSQLEEARLEMDGLKERRASLEKSRREPEALIAPVSGVIADGSAVAGQIAQPNAVVFHIIDPAHLWVEALSFESVGAAQNASGITSQGRKLRLSYRGSGFADRNQTIAVHFAIEGEEPGLRAGQFVSVLLNTDEKKSGVAVPRSALVRGSNGVDLVLEKTAAERFMPRQVRVEPLDADNVLVTSGLEAGKRIVTQGAELLSHVR